MKDKLWKAIKDYWLFIAIIGSGIYSAYQTVQQLNDFGLIKGGWELGVGIISFILSVALGVFKFAKKTRDLEQKEKELGNKQSLSSPEINVTSNNQSGGVTAGKIDKLVIQNDKKKDYSQSILKVYDKTSRLMNKAIKDTTDFGIMVERTDGRSRKERKDIAFKSKDAFNKFHEGNKHFFSSSVRNDIEKLDELMERSLRSLAICFNTIENMERDLNTPPYQTLMPQQITEIHGNFVSRSKVIQGHILESFLEFRESLIINVPQEKVKHFEKFDITPSVISNDKKWISVIVPNPTNQTMECYCVLKSVTHNGIINESIKRYVTSHSSRISWSGGDTVGKEEGLKVIDDYDMLNIVTPTKDGLGFEMAKGIRCLGDDFEQGIGKYKTNLAIYYRIVGEKDFQNKFFDVSFFCYTEESKISSKNMHPDIIRCSLNLLTFLDNETRPYLYLQIIREGNFVR